MERADLSWMRRRRADLHVRTTASMGRVAPIEAVELANEAGVSAIAIVDHDSVDGIPVAKLAGESYGVEVIPGIELTYEEKSKEAHIIGYYIDWRNQALVTAARMAQSWRSLRVQQILEKLEKIGIKITYGEVLEEAGKVSIIGRTHIARSMVKRKIVKTPAEAFGKYLAYGKPAYVLKQQLMLKQIMGLIRRAGGVPALAHPKFSNAVKLLPKLVKHGLKGLEVYHPYHTREETKLFKTLARKYNLIEVGGTDSEFKRAPVGTVTVPYAAVEKLKRERPLKDNLGS
jgi:hypothetical protein